MPATAIARADRSEIESLLRLRKLDRTIVHRPSSIVHRPDGHHPGDGPDDGRWPMDDGRWPIDDGRSVPTGIAALDTRLEGGFPRGHLSEVTGPQSSGRLAILVSALAGATARGETVALVDPLDMFDPVSASAAFRPFGDAQGRGIDFQRMLWVRGESMSSARVSLSCEYGTLQKALERAVKALNIILQAGSEAGGFGLVVLDLAEVAPQAIQRLPYTTWLRLHRVIEGSHTACVLIGSAPIARSSRGVSVQLSRPKAQSLESGALCIAHVVRSRAMESDGHVCVPLSAAAC
jgi:hypothetical protein